MIKVTIFLVINSLVSTFTLTSSERGNANICTINTGHVLEKQKNDGRQITIDVKFKNQYTVAPQVFVTPQLLDWAVGVPVGFSIQVSAITTTGFKLTGIGRGDTFVYSIHVNWVAINDPRVATVTLESSDLNALSTGTGERSVPLTASHSLKNAKKALIALIGVRHLKTNPIVEVKVDTVTDSNVKIIVRTYWEAALNFIRVNVLIGTNEALITFPTVLFYNAPASSHPFVKRNPGEAEVIQKFDLPSEWEKGGKLVFPTITGYDVERTKNFRIQFRDESVDSKHLQYAIATWWDTSVYGFYHQAGVYSSEPVKIFDPNCAELFSECDFKGDSFKICDKNNDIPSGGWNQPIKSINIPSGKQLYLYNQQNLQGQKTLFTSSQSCIDTFTFTFAQLNQKEIVQIAKN